MTRATPHGGDATRPTDGAEAWRTPGDRVLVTAPKADGGYYRLQWTTSEGQRGQTTGGRTFTKAWAKALARERDLELGATPRSEMPVSRGIEYWLDPNRPTPRGGWGDSHRYGMNAYARRYFLPHFGDKRCMDLRRSDIQRCVNAAPTSSEGRNIRRSAASMIGALRQGDYLLDNQVIDLSNVFWHGVTANDAQTSDSGERLEYVSPWKRPSNAQVEALRDAAARTGRRGKGQWWRGLMVEIAAYSGPRWSELVAVTTEVVDLDRRTIDLHWRVAESTGKARRLTPPKMAKRRTTIYPEVSPTGYRLGDLMRKRVDEVHVEQRQGLNRKGLLFPAPSGDWWWTGVFHRDFFEKSARAAGWEYSDLERPYDGVTRIERQWHLTWHSLRHTFCTVALEEWGLPESTVSLLAGHSVACRV
ncbi:site-specific integrase [Nocardioides sp. C4-1]|uniref:tyrosine-type recombinase/integrase n=1 Tax=Nocardioides sp. C4-1 TaxID=3151851 RepID=UPI0032672E2A